MIAHHSERCIERWGGSYEDYDPIHKFIDSTKLYVPTWNHRVLFHNTLGVSLVESIFNTTLINSSNKSISARTVAEKHILEDLGAIPTTTWSLTQAESKRCKLLDSRVHNKVKKLLTFEELQFIHLIYLQALDKSWVYFNNLLLDLLITKFGGERFSVYAKVINLIKEVDNVVDALSQIKVQRHMGGLSPKQIKYLKAKKHALEFKHT